MCTGGRAVLSKSLVKPLFEVLCVQFASPSEFHSNISEKLLGHPTNQRAEVVVRDFGVGREIFILGTPRPLMTNPTHTQGGGETRVCFPLRDNVPPKDLQVKTY